MSDHGGPGHGLAARVRHVEALLERRGLVDKGVLTAQEVSGD